VATAASSLKQGTRTAIRIEWEIMATTAWEGGGRLILLQLAEQQAT